jgi:hypothetical protein
MKEEDEEIYQERISWGLVCKADLKTIKEAKELLKRVPGLYIVYQCKSLGRLLIVSGNVEADGETHE